VGTSYPGSTVVQQVGVNTFETACSSETVVCISQFITHYTPVRQ
jgi:hypothetical protein